MEEIVECFLALLEEDDGDRDLEPSPWWSRTCATTTLDTSPETADLEEGLCAASGA